MINVSRTMVLALTCLGLAIAALVLPGQGRAQSLPPSGVWRSNTSAEKSGTWQMAATRSENTFSGTLTTTGPIAFSQGNVFGTTSERGEIHFGVIYNDAEVGSFTGSLSGATVTGSYTTNDGDSGVWSGTAGAPQE